MTHRPATAYLEDMAAALDEAGMSEQADQVRSRLADLAADTSPCGLCGDLQPAGYRFAAADNGHRPVRLCWAGPDADDCWHRWHEDGIRPQIELRAVRGGTVRATIPHAVLAHLGVDPGDRLVVAYNTDSVLLRRADGYPSDPL